MNDNELINYVFNLNLGREIKITDDIISFYFSNPNKTWKGENNEMIPFSSLSKIFEDTQRLFTISSGYNSLHLKFDRIDKTK